MTTSAKNNSMWGKHSAQDGWILNCLKSQQQPSVIQYSSQQATTSLRNQAITYHATQDARGKLRPKIIFFPISAEGVYEVRNHNDHGGLKLVYSDGTKLRYKTITPAQLAAVFLQNVTGQSFANIAASL
jgi:hypothetical protein